APEAGGPVRAYAEGLRAHLGGDAAAAARWLAGALEGHGDACRAAGEDVAALGLLGRPLGGGLTGLRGANHACVTRAALPGPPEARKRRRAATAEAHSPPWLPSSSPRGEP